MSFPGGLVKRHCEEIRSIDEAISGVCYYFMRLPRSLGLGLLAMTKSIIIRQHQL
ncbi:hypothetical protein [Rickettsia africae]|uniref:hypothetical protein n=1 Tax=Rickettsia africae TaxID=35788 RepID=UPI00190F3045|nr:hypothetical protein [Rickettsia africae]